MRFEAAEAMQALQARPATPTWSSIALTRPSMAWSNTANAVATAWRAIYNLIHGSPPVIADLFSVSLFLSPRSLHTGYLYLYFQQTFHKMADDECTPRIRGDQNQQEYRGAMKKYATHNAEGRTEYLRSCGLNSVKALTPEKNAAHFSNSYWTP